MKKLIIPLLLMMLGNLISIMAQENEMFTRIKDQLNPSVKKDMQKAEKYYSKQAEEKKLAAQFEGSRKRKALRKEIKASEYFGKANKICYKIFREDLQKFKNVQTDSAKAIKKRTNRAKRLMSEAKDKRKESVKLDVAKNEFSMLKHADELEQKAFDDIYFVYSIYLGAGIKNNIAKETTSDALHVYNSDSVSGNPGTENSDENKGTIIASGLATDDLVGANDEQNIKSTGEQKSEINQESLSESDVQIPVYFKIQIAASKTQLSVDHLVKNFKTKEVLNVEKEGEWYKYSIRKKFTDYESALSYRNELNIKGAFIIAFKNGKKVTIEEALKQEPITQNDPNKKESTQEEVLQSKPVLIKYKLQIGLSFNPLGPEEVRQFKNAGQTVTSHNCGSYYLYTIGDFDTESAAFNFKSLKGLVDAEIVKFINDKPAE